MKNTILALLIVSCGGTVSASADEDEFQFTKDVSTGALTQEELVAFPLDAQVFAATQDDFADVRLIDGNGNAVTYLLRQVKTTEPKTIRKSWPATNPEVRPIQDGGLEIMVQLEEDDPPPNGLRIITPLKNFEQRLQIFASDDGQQWQPAGDDSLIFDYSRYMDVRHVDVPFPPTGKRHFRIVIDSVTAEQESELLALTRRLRGGAEVEREERTRVDRRPFRIDRIEFWREREADAATGNQTVSYPAVAFTTANDGEKRQTLITVETNREPLTSLRIDTPARNFSRRAKVEFEEIQGVRKSWRTIGEATLSRIDFRSLQREQLEISFSQTRQRRYRIVIENGDSPPLEVTGVTPRGVVYESVFLARPDTAYQLMYGNQDAAPARFDVSPIKTLLDEGYSPQEAKLGEQTPGPEAKQAGFKPGDLLNSPIVMLGLISLLVVLLGWGLYTAGRRVESLPKE